MGFGNKNSTVTGVDRIECSNFATKTSIFTYAKRACIVQKIRLFPSFRDLIMSRNIFSIAIMFGVFLTRGIQ